MGRYPGVHLSGVEVRQLRRFMDETENKHEFRAAQGLIARSEGKSAEDVALNVGVTKKQVFMWTRKFRSDGIEGLHVKKQTGRPPTTAKAAKPIIETLIDEDPQSFGYLKGRWVLRDIARELKKEGVNIHYSSVYRILDDLGIKLKSPKLRAPGSIRKNYYKREQIKRYKRIAPALLKKVLIGFQDEKWTELLPKAERCWTRTGETKYIKTLGYTKRVNCFITLFWPRKHIVWNTFQRRRNVEFRIHLGNLIAYAFRHGIRRIILFVDHASYHETPEVERFLKQHPILKLIWLGKKDPNSNPTECLVNRRMSGAVAVNREHEDLNDLKRKTKKFLRKYNLIYAT